MLSTLNTGYMPVLFTVCTHVIFLFKPAVELQYNEKVLNTLAGKVCAFVFKLAFYK